MSQVLTADQQKIYSTCLGTLSAIGCCSNIAFLTTIAISGLESRLTTYLLRSQSCIDMTVCLISLLLVIFPDPLHSGVEWVDIISCRIWSSQALFWWLVLSSVYNLVYTAFDRYWAIVTPQNYKSNLRLKLIMGYFIIFGLCGFITGPSFLQARYLNGTCTPQLQYEGELIHDLFKAYSVIWFFSIYGIPAPLLIYLYTQVMLQLKSVKTDSNIKVKSAMKSFTLSTLVITAIFLVSISFDAIYYMLGYLGATTYIFNTPIQLVGVFLTSVNSTVNPVVFFIMVKSFRKKFIKIWCSRCIQNKNNQVSDSHSLTF